VRDPLRREHLAVVRRGEVEELIGFEVQHRGLGGRGSGETMPWAAPSWCHQSPTQRLSIEAPPSARM
jgi:hypothetical protein